MASLKKTFLMFIGFSFNAISGDLTSVVDYVQVNVNTPPNDNYAVVKFIAKATQQPLCVTDPAGRMIFSLSTEGGQALYSLILTAKLSNKSLSVYGTGLCHSGLEIISFARLK